MPRPRSTTRLALLPSIALGALLAPGVAQGYQPPKVGQQWVTAGLSLTPGFLYDETAPEEPGFGDVAAIGGGTLRLGMQHAVSPSLYMAAEGELGVAWFNEHTASSDARADSEAAFAWQLALLGRWLPSDDAGGLSLGFGAQLWRAELDDVSIQQLAGDLRVGWYIWQGSEFALVEVGYALPFISGLDLPTDFTGEGPQEAPQDWSLHRFSVGFNWGF